MFFKSLTQMTIESNTTIENMHLGKLLFPVTICLKFYKKECLFRELMLASCDQEKMLCFHTCEENTSFCDFVYEERAVGFSYIFYQKVKDNIDICALVALFSYFKMKCIFIAGMK